MKIAFTKMHGAGNDYVYINCLETPPHFNPTEIAPRICDRHKGVGGDGIVLICPSERGDARMRMYNADGSEAEMCGNAIRCVAKYLYDNNLRKKERLQIETGRGVLTLDLMTSAGKMERARVNMGEPILRSELIPTLLSGDPPIDQPLEEFRVTCVSMGNPHCVIFVPEITDELVLVRGRALENHRMFPKRVNVEFVKILSPREFQMRVWERGSGETQACGTGASAVLVAGVLSNRLERKATGHLLGGDLELEWSHSNEVSKTGPAEVSFEGIWEA